jgi:hypothetical protein
MSHTMIAGGVFELPRSGVVQPKVVRLVLVAGMEALALEAVHGLA